MSTQKEILDFLKSRKEEIRKQFSVSLIGLIGSYAEGKQSEFSDIDLLVEFSEPTYNNLAGLNIYLEKGLRRKIDIVSKNKYLKNSFLKAIEKEAIYV
jgi:predicted nucleotidyltransferase